MAPSMSRLNNWLNRYRRPLIVVLSAWSLTILAGLLIPVDLPDGGERGDRQNALLGATTEQLAAEDLTAFLDSRRWGVSLREISELRAGREQSAINPILAKMGFVGLITTVERTAMILMLPEGEITRLELGATLPDGRILAAVTENSLTLRDENQQEEKLLLFPQVRTDSTVEQN